MKHKNLSLKIKLGVVFLFTLVSIVFLTFTNSKTIQTSAEQEISDDFAETMAKMKAAKAEIMKRQADLLNARYDMSNRPAKETMSKGKPIQEGVRVKLPSGMTWEKLAAMSPEEIKEKGIFRKAFTASASQSSGRRNAFPAIPYR